MDISDFLLIGEALPISEQKRKTNSSRGQFRPCRGWISSGQAPLPIFSGFSYNTALSGLLFDTLGSAQAWRTSKKQHSADLQHSSHLAFQCLTLRIQLSSSFPLPQEQGLGCCWDDTYLHALQSPMGQEMFWDYPDLGFLSTLCNDSISTWKLFKEKLIYAWQWLKERGDGN